MSEFKSMINKIGKNITRTSKDVVNNAKMSMKLSSKEDKLNELYLEVGKKVYEIYSYGGNLGEFFDKKYKEMLNLKNEIKEIKLTMEENKQKSREEKEALKAELQAYREMQRQQAETEEIEKSEQIIEDSEKIVCTTCEKENDKNSSFCSDCGREL